MQRPDVTAYKRGLFTVAQAASRGQRVHDSTLQLSTGVKIDAAESPELFKMRSGLARPC